MQLLGLFIALIEWYDAAICISFAEILSEIFLPNLEKKLKFSLYLYIIAATYLGRPIGAYFIGKYSDEKSRLKASFFSFLTMVLSSSFLSILPTYSQIGYIAPLCFIFIRFIQGIAIGGNYATSVYSIEETEEKNKHFVSSLICIGIIGGFLFGSFTTYLTSVLFSQDFIKAFGWRMCLLGSLVLSIPVFINFPKEEVKQEAIKSEKLNYKLFFKSCLLMTIDIIPFYIFFTFLPNYKIMILGYNSPQIWAYHSISMAVIIIFTPIFGKLSDKFKAKNILKLCILFLSFISFFYPWDSFFYSIFLGLIMAMCYGSLYSFIALNFDRSNRAIASGIALNIVACLINISNPFFIKLMEFNPNYIGFPIFIIAIFSILALKGMKDI